VQKPHPPIWIGGDSMAALRRTAIRGNGWYPVGLAEKMPINTVARYAEAKAKLAALAEEAGRSIDDIELAYWAVWYGAPLDAILPDGSRRMLMGEPGQVAEDLNDLGNIGVSSVILNFINPTLDETLAATERFAKEVMANVDMG